MCDIVLGTIMNIEGKSKDFLNARLDLKEMRIRQEIHPIEVDREIMLPPACYTLTNDEKKSVLQWLSDIKVSEGYSANLSQCVNVKDDKISSMKTRDCHVFLERLLRLLVCDILPKHVSDALIELINFFRELCAKVLKENELDQLESQIVVTVCKLERIFPPAFFDIMIHLPIHLAWEAKVVRPLQYRWMYPIERFLHKLKGYVCNKARPESSIAEGDLADECLTFCSRYLHSVETKLNRQERNYDGGQLSTDTLSIFSTPGRSYRNLHVRELSHALHNAATLYMIQNYDGCLPFIEYLAIMGKKSNGLVTAGTTLDQYMINSNNNDDARLLGLTTLHHIFCFPCNIKIVRRNIKRENMVSLNQSEGAEKSSLAIYRQIVGPPKKCRVVGWGDEGSHKDIHVIPRRELELSIENGRRIK
ncbi:uncharacterized protein LOC102611324 isoform X2 [Citrus sinensis]|uniref:uncharacterized protein LOC102611324 isoform X2 n=1 Tax=Citrus sinensis TaxID=2711 RepID=UPI0022782B48|nr:uncharacterized protein LOC102611324 isoform X2 [Citrus sinensis]